MSDTGAGTGDVISANMRHLYTVNTDPESFTDPDKDNYRVERAELRDDFVNQLMQLLENCEFGHLGTLYFQTSTGKMCKVSHGGDSYFLELLNPDTISGGVVIDSKLSIMINTGSPRHIYPVSDEDVQRIRDIINGLKGDYKVLYQYTPQDVFRAEKHNTKHPFETAREVLQKAFQELESFEVEETEKVNCEENASVYGALEALMPEGVHCFEIGYYDRKYKVTRIGEDFRIKVMQYGGVDEWDDDSEDGYKYENSIWVDRKGNEDSDSCISKEDAEELEKVFPMLFVQNRTGKVLDA